MSTAPLYLTILRHGETIVMDFAEVDPVVPRSQIRVEPRLIAEITDELARVTALANMQSVLYVAPGEAGESRVDGAHIALQRLGELVFAHLFPASAQRRLIDADSTDLFLRIDDQLVHIPWELACDGRDFLLTKFRVGRQVISQQQHRNPGPRTLRGDDRLRLLIVVDPTETLPSAADEADRLCSLLDECSSVDCSLMSGRDVRKIDLLRSLGEYDVVHYAGHAFFDAQNPSASGWVLHDTVVTALELSQVRQPPSLVFSNACQAGATTPWEAEAAYQGEAFGIGSAFLLAGTQNYIGSFCVIYDAHSAAFAAEFYRHLLQGETVGMALRAARLQSRGLGGSGGLLWASYLHYGNPLCRLHMEIPAAAMPNVYESARAEEAVPEVVVATTRKPSPVRESPIEDQRTDTTPHEQESGADATRGISPASEPGPGRHTLRRRASYSKWFPPSRLARGAAGLLVLLVATAVLLRTQPWMGETAKPSGIAEAYRALDQGEWQQAEHLFRRQLEQADARQKSNANAGLAATAFARRNYRHALEFARQAESLDPDIAYSHIIRGHVLWRQGQTAEAAKAYQTAITKPHGTPWQYAIAHDRLGRISAASGNHQSALEHYDRAISMRGDMVSAYTNKAHLLEMLDRPQEATALYRRAQQIDPTDPLTALLLRQLIQRERLAQDQTKRERRERLINDIEQAIKEGKGRRELGDEWTSIPLTLALHRAQSNGLILARGGEDLLLIHRLEEALRASKRVEVVDRAEIDRILEEYKLMTSEGLIDPTSGLRVGKLLPARVNAVVGLEPLRDGVSLSVRVSETETSSVIFWETSSLGDSEAPNGAIVHLAGALLARLRQQYPLQGRIEAVTGPEVRLNIGARQGVTPGLILDVFPDDDLLSAVGRVQVAHVEANRCRARVIEQREAFQAQWKVKEEQH